MQVTAGPCAAPGPSAPAGQGLTASPPAAEFDVPGDPPYGAGVGSVYLYKRMGMCLCVMVPTGTKAYEAAGELLKVLSAPARLAIVAELSERPRFVHELVDRLGMSQPLVSQHLRVLRGARLVGVERHGREAAYSLADRHVAHIVADAVQHSREG